LLGAPVGDASFSVKTLEKRITAIEWTLKKLPLLQDSHQEYVLLRSCLALPKFRFCLRTCVPALHAASFVRFDGLQRETLGTILGRPLDEPQWRQASLPVSMGGLGLRCATVHSPGAFLVSIALTQPLVSAILHPRRGPRQYLPNVTTTITTLNATAATAYTMEDLHSTTQQSVSHAIDQKLQRDFMTSLPDTRVSVEYGCGLNIFMFGLLLFHFGCRNPNRPSIPL
jgi:hypothetical protein